MIDEQKFVAASERVTTLLRLLAEKCPEQFRAGHARGFVLAWLEKDGTMSAYLGPQE